MNPMGLSDPYTNSLENIALHPVENLPGINLMVLSEPRADNLDIVSLQKD